MPATYEPIATTTIVGTSTTSHTFSSIPSTYTDLLLIIGNAGASGAVQPGVRFNGDTGTNYSETNLSGNGTTIQSSRASNTTDIQIGYDDYLESTNNYTGVIHINNYTNTTTYKTVIARGNNAATGVGSTVGTWRNTAAITSLTVLPSYGSSYFLAGSTFTLYGIKSF